MCGSGAERDGDEQGAGSAGGWTLDDLGPGERALLGAFRGWKTAGRAGGGLGVVLHAVKGAGLPTAAVLPLAALLGVLDIAAGHDGRALRCVACRNVGRDEALLLDAVAAAQWGDAAEMSAILCGWFPASPAAAAAAGQKINDLARALGETATLFPGGRCAGPAAAYDNRGTAYALAAE